MANLSKTGIESWLERLPDDVKSIMTDAVDDKIDPEAVAFASKLSKIDDNQKVLELVEANLHLFEGFGRARRIRFLAWFASRTYPDSMEPFQILLNGEEAEDSGGERGAIEKVSMILAEDVRALAAALGPRAARQIVTGESLEAVTGAGYEVTSEMEMRQGGSV